MMKYLFLTSGSFTGSSSLNECENPDDLPVNISQISVELTIRAHEPAFTGLNGSGKCIDYSIFERRFSKSEF